LAVSVGTGPRALYAADLDSDGDLDVLVANHYDNTVSLLENTGSGALTPWQTLQSGAEPMSVVSADIEGDGAVDILIGNSAGNTVSVYRNAIVTDVDEEEYGDALPYRFELSQNYPNPFNPVTTIEYSVPRCSHVRIEVFNLLGQRVRTLINREQPVGSYTTTWDGRTSSGAPVATGIYLYRFQAGDHVETKKMLLVK